MRMPFYKKLTDEQKNKIEKNGIAVFFLSATLFGIPLIVLLFLLYKISLHPPSEQAGAGFLLVILIPGAIISIILFLVGIVCSVLNPCKSLLWLVFLNVLLIFNVWLLFYYSPNWIFYLFFALFFFFWINTVIFFLRSLFVVKSKVKGD